MDVFELHVQHVSMEHTMILGQITTRIYNACQPTTTNLQRASESRDIVASLMILHTNFISDWTRLRGQLINMAPAKPSQLAGIFDSNPVALQYHVDVSRHLAQVAWLDSRMTTYQAFLTDAIQSAYKLVNK
jgi:hypothetical protein